MRLSWLQNAMQAVVIAKPLTGPSISRSTEYYQAEWMEVSRFYNAGTWKRGFRE